MTPADSIRPQDAGVFAPRAVDEIIGESQALNSLLHRDKLPEVVAENVPVNLAALIPDADAVGVDALVPATSGSGLLGGGDNLPVEPADGEPLDQTRFHDVPQTYLAKYAAKVGVPLPLAGKLARCHLSLRDIEGLLAAGHDRSALREVRELRRYVTAMAVAIGVAR